jgi:hypothetical protein
MEPGMDQTVIPTGQFLPVVLGKSTKLVVHVCDEAVRIRDDHESMFIQRQLHIVQASL